MSLKQSWRGIGLLLLTIISNALRRRTEGIALAADGRAFCPDQSRAMPLRTDSLDWPVRVGIFILTIGFFLIS
jgi:energy-coupling factor transporter transmembrane protein EcfT